MIFPNPKLAVVDVSKLRDYCLDPHHPRGRHKARLFARALGMKQEHAAILRELILEAVPGAKCAPGLVDKYGTRYSAELRISFKNHSTIRSHRMDHRRFGGFPEVDYLLCEVNTHLMPVGISILDVVALTKDLPEHRLVAGQVGTVVETLAEGVFEVEFSDASGKTYALAAIPADSLIALRYGPVAA